MKMARATVYKGSSRILQAHSTSNEADPLQVQLKSEPSSPLIDHHGGMETSELLRELQEIAANDPASVDDRTPENLQHPVKIDHDGDEAAYTSIDSSTSKHQGSNDIKHNELFPIRKRVPASIAMLSKGITLDNRLRCRSSLGLPIRIECEICFTAFRREVDLRKHKRYYDKKLFQCPICWKSFRSVMQLLSHRKSSHRNIDWLKASVKCDYCSLTVRSKSSLQQHIFHSHDVINKPTNARKGEKIIKTEVMQNESFQPESSRSARKRKRDESINKYKRHVKNSLPANTRTCNDRILNKSLQSSKAFVKIHAIPNEVEALLSDCDKSPTKRKKLADSAQISESNVLVESLRSGKRRSINESTSILKADTGVKTEEVITAESKEIKPSIKNASNISQLKSPNMSLIPLRLVTRKWAPLKMRYKLKDCFVSLERIEIVDKNEKVQEDSDLEDFTGETSGRSIGVQLKNLEIALKKLEVPEDSSSQEEWSEPEPKLKRSIYRSSVCRTRFTTKQRLINHYLCFHTNFNHDECGICRIRCSNLKKLKRHLSFHCIKIIKSKQDHSPIDRKGPCDRYKKKYACRGCKKRFWLLSCLQKHEECCRFVCKVKSSSENNDNKAEVEDSSRLLDNNAEATESTEINPNVDDRSDNENVSSSVGETETFVPMTIDKEINEKVPITPINNRWWDNKVPHGVPLFPCPVCNTNFQTSFNLSEHKKKYQQSTATRCDICGTLFPSRSLQRSHLKSAHFAEPSIYKVRCTICDQGFAAKKYLRSHILHIHYDQIVRNIDEWRPIDSNYEMKCKVCKLIFKNRKRFIEHTLYYFEDEVYSCDLCKKKFMGQFRCHSHWKTAHYSKEIQQAYTHHCEVCNEGFMYKFHLHSHMFHIHDRGNDNTINGDQQVNSTDLYVCSTCEERFSTLLLLSQHQNVHANDGKYQCHQCERKCRSQSILNDHQRVSHSEDPTFQRSKCPICGEGILLKTSWTSHIKHAHENQKHQPSELSLENICTLNHLIGDENTERFDEIASVKAAQSTLSSDPGIAFNEEDVINITDDQPLNIEYTCAICDVKFTSMQELKNHKSSHGPTTYGCGENTLNETNLPPQDERLKTNEILSESNEVIDGEYKKLQKNESISRSAEMQHMSFSPAQSSDNILYSCPSKDMPCNFSIANIYSVELEEYEKIANNEVTQGNESINTHEGSKVVDDNPENNLKCHICNIVFTCEKTLQNHKIRFSNTGDYICEVCGRRFKWLKAYKKHVTKHHKKKNGMVPLWYCERCDEAFATRNSKIMHFSHIHDDIDVAGVNCDNVEKAPDNRRDSSVDFNVSSSSQDQLADGNEVYLEEVDLIEDDLEAANTQFAKAISTSSTTVKPTMIQRNKVEANNSRLVNAFPDICPIFCNICHLQCSSIEFLVKHIENAHGIRLTPYKANHPTKESNAGINSTSEQKNIATQSSYQSNQGKMKSTPAYKIDKLESQLSALIFQCKMCRMEFSNEYSLVSHIRTVHSNSGAVDFRDACNSSAGSINNLENRNASKSDAQLMERKQVIIDNASRETSFLDSEKHGTSSVIKEPQKNERPMDLTKRKEIVLTKIDLQNDSTKGYRIIGTKDAQGNIQIINVQKRDLVNLTRKRL